MASSAQSAVYSAEQVAYRVGGFTLDMGRRVLLTAEGAEVPLRPKSLSMLLLLVENAGRTLSNDAIMSAVWPGLFVTENNITQCVHEIRQALGAKAQQILRTRPRHGYLITEGVVAIPVARDFESGVEAPDSPAASRQAFQAGSPSNDGAGSHGIVQLKVVPHPVHGRGYEHGSGRVTSPEVLLKPIGTRNLHCSDCDVDVPVGHLADKTEGNSSRPTTNALDKDCRLDGLTRSVLLAEATVIGKPGAPRADHRDIDAVTVVSVDPEQSNPSGAPRLSLVVLPFVNMCDDPKEEYFVDGITECLTTDLSRIRGAFVIARNTAFTYKGKSLDAKTIGRELNAERF